MAVSPKLEVRLTRQLALTPQLQQAISLLQMTNAELADFLQAEAERNPFLEFQGPATRSGTAFYGAEDIGESETLAHALIRQIATMRAPQDQRALAAEIAHHLDDDGYLRTPREEIMALHGCSVELTEQAVSLVQACSPTGVGARSLGECLRLQLEENGQFDLAMGILTNNMPLIAKQDMRGLKRLTGLPITELRPRLDILRRLDPAPGSRFAVAEAVTRIPDIVVVADGKGGWRVGHRPGSLPQVNLSTDFPVSTRGTAQVLSRELEELGKRSAWLIRTLNHRARTILRVAGAILRLQEGFLHKGEGALVPMTMKQVAGMAGVHESTVSRAVTGKFIECPLGIFSMRKLFSTKLPGQTVSGESVRYRIARILDAEKNVRALTDQQIADRLAGDGIMIARRTVAKYRGALRASASTHRRLLKSGPLVVL